MLFDTDVIAALADGTTEMVRCEECGCLFLSRIVGSMDIDEERDVVVVTSYLDTHCGISPDDNFQYH